MQQRSALACGWDSRSSKRDQRRLCLALALLTLACGSGPLDEDDPWPSSDASIPAEETVGWLDERAVTYGGVARYMRSKDPEAFYRNLEGLLVEKVTRAEAEPLGIEVPGPLVTRATERRMREWRARVRAESKRQTGEEIDPALYLRRVAGMSVARLRTLVREQTGIELLTDRLLRFELLKSRRVTVSILVIADKEEAARLAREGRQSSKKFAALVRKHSVHVSADEGGRIPFAWIPDDVSDAEVRQALFAAKKGAVVGPFKARSGDRSYYHVYRVEEVGKPEDGDYEVLRRRVERDLDARPVHVGEYERWRRRILLRHGFVAAAQAGESG